MESEREEGNGGPCGEAVEVSPELIVEARLHSVGDAGILQAAMDLIVDFHLLTLLAALRRRGRSRRRRGVVVVVHSGAAAAAAALVILHRYHHHRNHHKMPMRLSASREYM